MKFSKFDSSLYIYLAKLLGTEATLKAFEIENQYRAGYFEVGDEDDPINLVFSFPKESNDCYLMFTDGDPKKISLELASIQTYNENTAHLCYMHTVKTDSAYFKENGWKAFLITTPAMALDEIPNFTSIDNKDISFRLLVLLDENQYRLKLECGYDALLDYFEETGKDIVAFSV